MVYVNSRKLWQVQIFLPCVHNGWMDLFCFKTTFSLLFFPSQISHGMIKKKRIFPHGWAPILWLSCACTGFAHCLAYLLWGVDWGNDSQLIEEMILSFHLIKAQKRLETVPLLFPNYLDGASLKWLHNPLLPIHASPLLVHVPQQLFFIISFHLCLTFPFLCVTTMHRACPPLPRAHEHCKKSKQVILNHTPDNSNQHRAGGRHRGMPSQVQFCFQDVTGPCHRWSNGNPWAWLASQRCPGVTVVQFINPQRFGSCKRGDAVMKMLWLWIHLISIANHSTSLGKASSAMKGHKKLPRNPHIELWFWGRVGNVRMCTLVF